MWDGLRGLRKDNTGYDMKQLFIGAEGTLGIITAAVLRLFPKPTEAQSAWIAVDSPTAGLDLLVHMKSAMGEAITSFELIRRSIIEFLLTGVPGHIDPLPAGASLVRADGSDGAGRGRLAERAADEALESAVEKGLVRDAVIASSGEQAQAPVAHARGSAGRAEGGRRQHRP